MRSLGVRLTSSLWFVPSTLVVLAVTLAIVLIWVDTNVAREALYRFPRLFGAGPDGSRSMLAAIAGSMITVAGVTFSITIVAVAQASNQYTSRILRNFMGDRANQIVLGVFLGIFAYCLIVIRTIRGEGALEFVPAVSTLVAFLLAIVGIGFLIYFIHHIAESLQAENLLARVSHETRQVAERLYPRLGPIATEAEIAPQAASHWRPVPADRTGYIQGVDVQQLEELAERAGALIRMDRAIGEFVVEGQPLASLAAAPPSEISELQIAKAWQITAYRTVHQDVGFGVRQLVDVALKALSPGINDTTTAIASLDHLASVLACLAPRSIDGLLRVGSRQTRLIARSTTFESFVDAAFDEIRRNAAGNTNVLARILTALQTVGEFTVDDARRAHLRLQVDRVEQVARRSVPEAAERNWLVRRCDEVRALLT